MTDEDIFDYMNKRFKKMFKEWSVFGDDFDDMFKDIDETFEIRSPKTKFHEDGKSKSYSISYKYQTGMKEPEIRVSGDATEKDVDKFLSGVQKRFGNHMIGLSDKKPITLGLGSGEKEADGYKVPFMDIVDEDEYVEIVLEMPGIGEKDLKVEIEGKNVFITGENGPSKYKRDITLDFEPKKKIKARENHGIITIQLKK
ncbi:MAG: Hsp20/alpha crystallin family protein [Promethearchaeota archaeon]|nr:MAG: Hsp20/alpha crystallin family protein [Candidatus Lokiarchaeota archaeon]